MSRKIIDDSKIIKLYVKENLSGRQIAKKTNYALTTIQRILKKYNVTRNLKEARVNLFQKGYKHPSKKDLDEKRIIDLYTKENKSLPAIAKLFNCSLSPILRVLRKNNIPIKSLSESHKGKVGYWTGKKRLDISTRLKGIKRSKETREKLRLSGLRQKSSKKGKRYEEIYGEERANELKEKLSKSHIGQISLRKDKSFEELYGVERAKLKREKLSLITKQQFSCEEARKKQSERIKQFVENNPRWKELKKKQSKEYHRVHPEFAKSHSEKMKKYYSDPRNKEAMISRLKKFYQDNPAMLNKMSVVQKKIWATPEKREYARQRRFKQKFPFKHTLPEKLVFDEMQLRDITFEEHKTVLRAYPIRLTSM